MNQMVVALPTSDSYFTQLPLTHGTPCAKLVLENDLSAEPRNRSLNGLGDSMNSLQSTANRNDHYQDSHLKVDFQQQTVELDGQLLELTQKEFDLLALLVRQAGELVPRPMLLMLVWGYGVEIRTRTLDVHIRRLRKNLGCYATQYIETVFGVGYRFQPSH
jgi:DNA-binding response OmpR family regulator